MRPRWDSDSPECPRGTSFPDGTRVSHRTSTTVSTPLGSFLPSFSQPPKLP